ncbi:hypothetical protein HanRHA438_Chr14g0670051 [Helianthus annuus]|nr:hypothetical protein HanRHA438_Chr14g0670051 [Helianthus annuus]
MLGILIWYVGLMNYVGLMWTLVIFVQWTFVGLPVFLLILVPFECFEYG